MGDDQKKGARVLKKILLNLIELLARRIIFPASRWYRSNLFLFQNRNKWLKEKPSWGWLMLGKPWMFFNRLLKKIEYFYLEAIVSSYTKLLKKHYQDNYAFNKNVIFDVDYENEIKAQHGSMAELLKNKFLSGIAGISDGDSFLECGCGLGLNVKDILFYYPRSKAVAFDLSSNAVELAQKMFSGKNAKFFQGSVLDMGLFNSFEDNSLDHVFFANMLATIFSNTIEETRKIRAEIIAQAVRIARKNVILNEIYRDSINIYIEQKYRALFYEDFSLYFNTYRAQGNILAAPRFIIFHKDGIK